MLNGTNLTVFGTFQQINSDNMYYLYNSSCAFSFICLVAGESIFGFISITRLAIAFAFITFQLS